MKAKLIMFRQDGSKREFPLYPGATTVGRKEDCSIRIPLGTVSRRHCEIFLEDDGLTLKDLGAATRSESKMVATRASPRPPSAVSAK